MPLDDVDAEVESRIPAVVTTVGYVLAVAANVAFTIVMMRQTDEGKALTNPLIDKAARWWTATRARYAWASSKFDRDRHAVVKEAERVTRARRR
jgi:hypothetical protein